eukprot:TRINITY_DN15762_c0_g1_i1.p1 TRINITY_DN15762_c0_g1~~TRINITY_DN15762_c0_g1_i1.p1  ORF type:complete len:507 (+),score=167.50 TRINITY_DN15762_c0_g1_i1:62-1522(+)
MEPPAQPVLRWRARALVVLVLCLLFVCAWQTGVVPRFGPDADDFVGTEPPPSPAPARTPPALRMHVVFSTACNAFFHWQAQTVLWTALQTMGESANFTLIVVGCDAGGVPDENLTHSTHQKEQEKVVPPEAWVRLVAPPHFRVHFAPSCPQAKSFPWYNKPWSFLHWFQETSPREDVVVILDPDQFFLTGLEEPRGSAAALTTVSAAAQREVTGVVAPHRAVAQQYGFGSSWFQFRDATCPAGSLCRSANESYATDYFSVGPPLMVHSSDARSLLWFEYMQPVLAQDGGRDILADMWAYSMAAAHLDVPHQRYDHFMVSNTRADGEGWQWVDELKTMSCRDPGPFLATARRLPTVLHAASHAKVGYPPIPADRHGYDIEEHPLGGDLWNFHKGHVPAEFLDCDQPLLVRPPDDLFNVQTETLGRREAFFVCLYTFVVNGAAHAYKSRNCPNGHAAQECVRLVVTHEQAAAGLSEGQPRYPLARRVC